MSTEGAGHNAITPDSNNFHAWQQFHSVSIHSRSIPILSPSNFRFSCFASQGVKLTMPIRLKQAGAWSFDSAHVRLNPDTVMRAYRYIRFFWNQTNLC
ncbi:hypothetical protein DESC_60013 [Desulfosarcina cetonica]|nr:hypothetical protein DESC_60013 [Desulfosarcina cetonica]